MQCQRITGQRTPGRICIIGDSVTPHGKEGLAARAIEKGSASEALGVTQRARGSVKRETARVIRQRGGVGNAQALGADTRAPWVLSCATIAGLALWSVLRPRGWKIVPRGGKSCVTLLLSEVDVVAGRQILVCRGNPLAEEGSSTSAIFLRKRYIDKTLFDLRLTDHQQEEREGEGFCKSWLRQSSLQGELNPAGSTPRDHAGS